jgi:hypothetical protein
MTLSNVRENRHREMHDNSTVNSRVHGYSEPFIRHVFAHVILMF